MRYIAIALVAFAGCDLESARPTRTRLVAEPVGNGLSESTAPPAQRAVSHRVEAKQLLAQYQANEVAADQVYKGQWIEVSGVADGASKALIGSDMYILLR